MIPKDSNKLKKFIHGSLEDQLSDKIKNNVNKIIKSMGKDDEFEFMFFNYKKNENMMGFENYLNVLEYMNYLNKSKKIKLNKYTSMDVIYGDDYQDDVRSVFRITINDLDNINRYMEMLHQRNNHVIFSMLANLSEETKSINIIKKIKDQKNIYDIDEYDIRARLSKEINVTGKELEMLKNLNENDRDKIIFRFKQRVSLEIINENNTKMSIDLTNIKMNRNINRIYNSISNYELEIDIMTNKADDKLISKLYSESTMLLKILQQSNFIMGKDLENEILNRYSNLLNVNKEKMISLAGRKPQSLEIQHVVEKLPNKYGVTDKADGERVFLMIYNNVVFIISNNLHIRNTGIILPSSKSKYNDSIMDGELIFLPRKNKYILMIFDCLYNSGKDCREFTSFEKRLNEADDIIKNCFVNENHMGFNFKKYKGEFNVNKIAQFHNNEIDSYMKALNNDINKQKIYPLIRRKYFILVEGGNDYEIFKYSQILWNKYVMDNDTNCPYILDGLIYHPLEQKYTTSIKESKFVEYKWKPVNKNSIDFYIKFVKSNETGKILTLYDNSNDDYIRDKPYKIVNLYVGLTQRNEEKPVLFEEKDKKYIANLFLFDGNVRDMEGKIIQDNTVVEFYYNNDPNIPEAFRWVPMRTRHDKTESVQRYQKKYGNYYDVAKKIWRSIKNPFTFNDINILANENNYRKHIDLLRSKIDHSVILSEAKENAYYQIRTTLGKPMRNFHNWLKSMIIYTHCNPIYENNKSQTVLDIACGRGGDIMKFYYSKVDLYVGIDIDNNGLISPTDGAISRYNQLRKTHPNFPRMFFVHADGGVLLNYNDQLKALGSMSQSNEKIMKQFFSENPSNRFKFDRLNCQFAIHYFFANDNTWNNFVQNVNMYLKPGGYMMISTFDGETIMNLLSEKDNYTSYYTNTKGEKKILFDMVKKYELNDKSQIVGPGYPIDIFNSLISQEGVYITEYLVDKRFLEKEFLEKCNMELIETDLFENQFNIHRDYFKNIIQFEENPKTKQFFMKAAEYYDQENEVNKACFEMTRLNRFYIFRKKEDKLQKGGFYDTTINDVKNYINPRKFVKRIFNDPSEYSFYNSVYDVLKTNDIIPNTLKLDEFYKDVNLNLVKDSSLRTNSIRKLCNSLVIGHETSKKDVDLAINGVNILILENGNNDGSNNILVKTIGKNKNKISTKDPSIILYKDKNSYCPIYRSKEGNLNGIYNSKMRFIRKILNDSNKN